MSGTTSKSLRSYMIKINGATEQIQETVTTQFSDESVAKPPPMLQSQSMNRILVFYGSFNPPHRGHLKTLLHGLHHSDINVVGAILVAVDDEKVRAKYCRRSNNDKVLTAEQRMLLWEREPDFPRLSAYTTTSQTEYGKLRTQLSELIQADGYKISFVRLYGPDCLSRSSPPSAGTGSNEVIISERSRDATALRSKTDRIIRFEDWNSWRFVTQHCHITQPLLHEDDPSKNDEKTDQRQDSTDQAKSKDLDVKTTPAETQNVNQPHTTILDSESKSPYWLREKARFLKWNGDRNPISSTMIRSLLRYRSEYELEGLALSPELLREMWYDHEDQASIEDAWDWVVSDCGEGEDANDDIIELDTPAET